MGRRGKKRNAWGSGRNKENEWEWGGRDEESGLISLLITLLHQGIEKRKKGNAWGRGRKKGRGWGRRGRDVRGRVALSHFIHPSAHASLTFPAHSAPPSKGRGRREMHGEEGERREVNGEGKEGMRRVALSHFINSSLPASLSFPAPYAPPRRRGGRREQYVER